MAAKSKRKWLRDLVLVVMFLIQLGLICAIVYNRSEEYAKHGELSEDAKIEIPMSALGEQLVSILIFLVILVWIYIAYLKFLHRESKQHVVTEKFKTQTLVDSLADGIVILDDHDRMVTINAHASAMLGIEPTKWIGKAISPLVGDKVNNAITGNQFGIQDFKPAKSDRPLTIAMRAIEGNPPGKLLSFKYQKVITESPAEKGISLKIASEAVESVTKLAQAASEHPDGLGSSVLDASLITLEMVMSASNSQISLAEQPAKREMSLLTVIKDASAPFQELAKLKGLEFIPPEGDTPIKIIADPILISKTISEILLNSLIYTESGKIQIEISVDDAEVQVVITDSGLGIMHDEISSIFDANFRGSEQTELSRCGTGAGLHFAQKAVEAHGGTIWAESEPGRGTRITFSIPK
ncbi:ATP-binding protein [Planctomycetota bacterium]